MKMLLFAALLAGAAGLLVSQPEAPLRVGVQSDGSAIVTTGARIAPAGRQIPLDTMPMASAMSPDGKFIAVMQAGYQPPLISLLDATTLQTVHQLPLPDAWLGMAFASGSNLLYVSGGSRSEVYEIALAAGARLELKRTIPLVAAAQRKHSDFAGDLAVSPDGRMLYVAGLHRDSIFAVNLQSGVVVEEWKTGHRPYRLLLHPDGKWLYVTGWGDGFLYRHSVADGARISRLPVGPAPMDMVWRGKPTIVEGEAEEGEKPSTAPYAARIFVAVSNTNTVAAVGVNEDGSLRMLERMNVALYPAQPVGMTPSALALSQDQDSLYVVCSDANAVAVAGVATARTSVKGFIPTGWYPTAVRQLPSRQLLVFNGRGNRSFPNPGGPNPTRRPAPTHEGNAAIQYVGRIQKGSASLIEPFDETRLVGYTTEVMRNTPFRTRMLEDAGSPKGSVIPAAADARGPIRHVIYVVKENRTYDQMLGDLGIGNGDPSLTLFGEEITPNHRKLARDFVLLDNFYVNADVSADGHNWSSAAIAPAYVQRMWPNSYGGRRRHYDYEGGERAALPPAGYIWSNAISAQLNIRNFGWWCTNITPRPAEGRQVSAVRDPALAPYTNMNFRAFDLDYPDVERVQPFLAELREWEASGKMPDLMMIRLGNDHTSGTAPGKTAPKAAVADNDAALGMLVEAVSKSRFWGQTAIFVLEDDAQNGPDHVDSHRSPAFVISPYTRGRGVDSTMYNTTSMLRTMELILGLRPMTMHDAGAMPMWRAFRDRADARPWQAEKPRVPIDEKNPPNSPTAARSRRLDLDEADRIDDHELNEILWLALKGPEPPAPVRSIFGR